MLADKKGGNLKVHNKVVLIDNNDAYAGLGIFYRPLTNGYKRFRFGGNWNNYWVDDSFILTANNYGFVGIYIVEFDPDGTNMKIIQDRRYPLWNDGTGWFEHHEDTVEGAAGGFESFPFYGSPEKRYICWAWCGCQVESDDENALGLLPAASFAEALLEIHISAMSIKEA